MKKFFSRAKLIAVLCTTCVFAFAGGVAATSFDKQAAVAETTSVEYTDWLGLEDRTSWASGGHADIVTFGLMDFSITEGSQYFKSSVSDCWYKGNSNVIAANNGVDILQYVYVDGVSARALLDANTGKATANTSSWLSNPAAWPIAFETGADVWIRIDKTAFDGDFTFTFKKGFSLTRNDGVVVYLDNDISYTYANGALGAKAVVKEYTLSFEGTEENKTVKGGDAIGDLPAVPEKAGYVGFWEVDGVAITKNTVWTHEANKQAKAAYALEYKDLLGLEDRAWGAHEGEYYFGGVTLEPFGYFNSAAAVCNTWYVGNNDVIAANNGVDIMEYIYVNGVSARTLIKANVNGSNHANACGCWLSNPAAYPVYVETTNGSGILIRIAKAHVGDNFTLTFKEGFSLIRNDGERIYVSEDVNYKYENDTLIGEPRFTMSFAGLETTQRVKYNAAIGKLPAVPEKIGYDGVWTIEGAEITADSIYTYGENKTAVASYTAKNYALSFDNEGVSAGTITVTYDSAIGELPVLENKGNLFGVWKIGEEIITAETIWNFTEDKTATAEYSERKYVLTCGEAENAATINVSYGVAIGELPAIEEKTGYDGVWKIGEDVITADTVWMYNEDKTAAVVYTAKSYTLSFGEVEADALVVTYDVAIGELPEVPEKEGYTGVWTIDGVEITDETVWNFTEDKTAEVSYTANKYSVTFDGENATEYAYGDLIAKPADPTKASTAEFDYTFDGWYNGAKKWDFEKDTVTANVNLVAQYTESKREYTVSFNITGRDDITLNSVKVAYGESYDLLNLFTAEQTEDYTYSVTVNGVEKASITVTADVTVEIVFTQKAVEEPVVAGCFGSVSGLGVAALGLCAIALFKKKEN